MTDTTKADDARMFRRVAAGEPGAVEAFVDQYGSLVWSLALRQTRTRDEAEDAVQEIFLDLWRSAERFDSTRASGAGFVAMIARRRLIDRTRKEQRRPTLTAMPEGLDVTSDEHERLERSIEAGQIMTVLQGLPDRQREAIELSVVTGLSHAQIAERTDTPLGTVKSNIRRGMAELRRRLLERNPGSAGAV